MISNFIEPSLLADNCDSSSNEEIRIQFTEEEMIELKEQLTSVTMQVNLKESLLAKVKYNIAKFFDPVGFIEELESFIGEEDFDSRSMDMLKDEKAELIPKIKKGFEFRKETLYHFRHDDEGIIASYDSKGYLVSQRTMRPDERQATIYSSLKKI